MNDVRAVFFSALYLLAFLQRVFCLRVVTCASDCLLLSFVLFQHRTHSIANIHALLQKKSYYKTSNRSHGRTENEEMRSRNTSAMCNRVSVVATKLTKFWREL